MKSILLLIPLFLFPTTLFCQVGIPAANCNCPIMHKNNFAFCTDTLKYQTIWTSVKITRSDIENRNYFPPDKDFFPGIVSIDYSSWTRLENQVKYWAIEFDSVFVVTGKTTLDAGIDSIRKTLYYKAILKGCKGDAIGFLVGDKETYPDLISYAVAVDSLENITGFDFFPGLNPDIQSIIESSFNADFWTIYVP
jgi:DNA/RNA endonuclease G (NUC1)